jgi:hypothetical protein
MCHKCLWSKELRLLRYNPNLIQLLDLAGLKSDFDAAQLAGRRLARNWETVKEWTEESRYIRTSKAKAEKLYEAIRDKKRGVLSWLKQRW